MAIIGGASPIKLKTTLGDGVAVFRAMTGSEELGRPYSYQVEFVSILPDLDPGDLLGQPMTVSMDLESGQRHFNGIVTALTNLGTVSLEASPFGVGPDVPLTGYLATVRPKLALLEHASDHRIFQQLSIPDIAMMLISEFDGGDVEQRLVQTHPAVEFLVQYGETALDFINRILERAGIYYFYKHGADGHTLVMTDNTNGHENVPDYETLEYDPGRSAVPGPEQSLTTLRRHLQVTSGAFAHTDYEFKRPNALLYTRSAAPKVPQAALLEQYSYPGGHSDYAEGDARSRVQLEHAQAGHEQFDATTFARGMTNGALINLTHLQDASYNGEYIVVAASYRLEGHDLSSGSASTEQPFSASLRIADAAVPFRPALRIRAPVIAGVQTAVVVGPPGEEIYTDEHGRIKVHFHWDRRGNRDQTSSCWVRVAQAWAGGGWGAQFIPRIEQEVVVHFLEGNPDRPLVLGSVYNGENRPPFAPEITPTHSGLRSHSTKGGAATHCNEIRFDDKKGAEDLLLHAEKNHTITVENDESRNVQQNRSATVGANDSVSVGGDRSLHVTGNLSITVDGQGKSPTHSETTVTGKHKLHASDTIDVDAPTHINLQCGGSSILIEPGKITITAGGKALVVLDANVLVQSSAGSKVVLDANALAEASGAAQVLLDANALVRSSAGSQLLLDASAATHTHGDVLFDGTNITGTGLAQVTMKVAASSVQVTPASTTVAAPAVNVNGTAIVAVTAPMIKVG